MQFSLSLMLCFNDILSLYVKAAKLASRLGLFFDSMHKVSHILPDPSTPIPQGWHNLVVLQRKYFHFPQRRGRRRGRCHLSISSFQQWPNLGIASSRSCYQIFTTYCGWWMILKESHFSLLSLAHMKNIWPQGWTVWFQQRLPAHHRIS